MILISHRGNLNGPNPKKENSPEYIKRAIKAGFDVECDVWWDDGFWLGHDHPQYQVKKEFFNSNWDRLWCHAKDVGALEEIQALGIHVFFHALDGATLTSKNIIWYHPHVLPRSNGINVLPEKWGFGPNILKGVPGICSDYIKRYKCLA